MPVAARRTNDLTPTPRPAARLRQVETARKLHLGHFAFMRAVVQGIDASRAWERYLQIEGSHRDARTVRRTIAWIRDAFAASARRENRFGTARLVVTDIDKLLPEASTGISLDEFVAEQNLDGFSQRDQLDAYQAAHGGAAARQVRRGKLVVKQLEALRWLEALAAQAPAAGDPIAAWLNPDLAGHLHQANLLTVGQLVTHINGSGRRWYTAVPAIGESKAKRITDWLQAHQASIGMTLGSHVGLAHAQLAPGQLARVVPRQTAIVPLDKLIVPHALDGHDGIYRAPLKQCMLDARNDHEAVLTWIRTRQGILPEKKAALKAQRQADSAAPDGPLEWLRYLSHTQRAYLKEAERFMLWAIVQHKKPLSSMSMEDCEQYRQFLADPSPREIWCSTKSAEKWSPLWRPFRGPLSRSAQNQAMTILRSLYTFLAAQGYLIGNPWKGLSLPKTTRIPVNRGRSFTHEQWAFIQTQADLLTEKSVHRRLRFALRLFYTTGLRLVEGVQARCDDLKRVEYPDPDTGGMTRGWELLVLGKGQKERLVSVPDAVVDELGAYLVSRGLDADPELSGNRGAYLIGQGTDAPAWSAVAQAGIGRKDGISDAVMYRQFKAFFRECANAMTPIDARGAERLAAGSSHWLRHTHGTHAVAAGMPLDVVQQNMGHASLDTTTGYITSAAQRRLKASRRVFG
jgi:site-specific recombinase XerD